MKGKRKVVGLVCALAVAAMLAACTAQNAAQRAQAIIGVTLNIAKADINLVAPGDQSAFTNWVNLGISLDGQLGVCIANVSGLTGKNAKFASCFGTFASAFLSPAELAGFRIVDPKTQARVQLYAAAAIAAINVFEGAIGNANLPTPAIGPAPTAEQLGALRNGIQAEVDFALPAYGR